MTEAVTVFLVLVGASFMAIAALGMVRMPDLFMRMSSATKAATLGVGLIMIAVAVYFADTGVTSRALAVIVFLILTSPVAAHVIARAAYYSGVPLWEKTMADELRGKESFQPANRAKKKSNPKRRPRAKKTRKR
jgi:multicomponent Na+:H+ antiporter subunit G